MPCLNVSWVKSETPERKIRFSFWDVLSVSLQLSPEILLSFPVRKFIIFMQQIDTRGRKMTVDFQKITATSFWLYFCVSLQCHDISLSPIWQISGHFHVLNSWLKSGREQRKPKMNSLERCFLLTCAYNWQKDWIWALGDDEFKLGVSRTVK